MPTAVRAESGAVHLMAMWALQLPELSQTQHSECIGMYVCLLSLILTTEKQSITHTILPFLYSVFVNILYLKSLPYVFYIYVYTYVCIR